MHGIQRKSWMKSMAGGLWAPAVLVMLAAPLTTMADERAVAPPEKKPEPIGLLLPAVQKAQPETSGEEAKPAPRGIQATPQRGIEPDEIDAPARARAGSAAPSGKVIDKSSPLLMKSAGGGGGAGKVSVQQMMAKLKPRQAMSVAPRPGSGAGAATSVQARPTAPPRYEIADCGTPSSPMICCHHEAGDGSSCNLFKILCGNAGGTAQGDGESAACSDW
ncbi:hypothetical protein [Wenzhouxiangella sp. XN24]|uniref:hypothetical protein n=1 Tax=Wenzhouxiangella sp. XN24 TaxID=2713569 RepID=UPI0013EBB6DE|nr:hypothetical protein [Wenzhouxiangella sp. XN24]NGX16304.1 hypothetical protein [Wenzhouxiangella sp. XN24]